jgi:hypothetical protein
MSDKDVDAQFADIIAHWDDVAVLPEDRAPGYAAAPPSDDTAPVPPAGGDDTPPEAGTQPAVEVPADTPRPGVNPPPDRTFVVWRGAAPAHRADDDLDDLDDLDRESADDEDDDEHFHPGPTAPLPPQEDLHFWGIVVGLVAGPLLLLWLVIFHPSVSGWWTLGALGLTVGGFVLLVLRQPHTRDEDDPDDGARI